MFFPRWKETRRPENGWKWSKFYGKWEQIKGKKTRRLEAKRFTGLA